MTNQAMGSHSHDVPGPGAVRRTVARDRSCAATARRIAREAVGAMLSEPALERVLLAVSELVTNAWKHGHGTIELRLGVPGPEVLRIEVLDEGVGATPRIRAASGDARGGWGLRILDEVSLRWGCCDGPTHVWAELPVR